MTDIPSQQRSSCCCCCNAGIAAAAQICHPTSRDDNGILARLQCILQSMMVAPGGGPPPVLLEACILCGRILLPGIDRRYKDLCTLADLVRKRCHATPYVYSCILEEEEQQREPSKKRACCCIACINWVRRLSSSSSHSSSSSSGTSQQRQQQQLLLPRRTKIPIPMDNLLLFMQCPGAAIVRPDQRSLHRMMGSLANQVVVGTCCSAKTVDNIYLRFCTPIMERSIAMFRTKYMRPICQERLASICRENSICCALELYTTNLVAGTAAPESVVDDLVRVWWESTGMPMVLTDRTTARCTPSLIFFTLIFCCFFFAFFLC